MHYGKPGIKGRMMMMNGVEVGMVPCQNSGKSDVFFFCTE